MTDQLLHKLTGIASDLKEMQKEAEKAFFEQLKNSELTDEQKHEMQKAYNQAVNNKLDTKAFVKKWQ